MIHQICRTNFCSGFVSRSKRCIPLYIRWQSSLITDPLPPDTSSGSHSNLSGQNPPVLPPTSSQSPPNTNLFVGLPTRHSRKQLPTVITDLIQLTELASEVIESDIGRLFTYNEYAIDKKQAETTASDVRI